LQSLQCLDAHFSVHSQHVHAAQMHLDGVGEKCYTTRASSLFSHAFDGPLFREYLEY